MLEKLKLSTETRRDAALALGALAGGALLGWLTVAPHLQSPALVARLGGYVLPVAFAAFLVALSLHRPVAAVALWLLAAPYSRYAGLDFSFGAGVPDVTLTRWFVAWLMLLLAVQAARGRRRLDRLTAADAAYLLFAVAMFVSAPRSHWGAVTALQAVFDVYLVPFLALYALRQLVADRRDLGLIALALLLMGMGLAFLVIREQVTGEVLFYAKQSLPYSRSFRKVVSLMGNAAPMGVTAALTLALPLMLAAQAFRSRRWAALALLAVGLGFVAVGAFMTYNRASWLGLVVTLATFVVLRPAARRLLLPPLAVAGVLAALFWSSLVSSPVVTERLLEERSVDYRTTAAELSVAIAQQEPLLGVGFSNFGVEAARRYGWDPAGRLDQWAAAHNSYLYVLVSAGLLAFLPYAAWIALLAWGWLQRWRRGLTEPNGLLREGLLDALAAGLAMFLTYFLASATFDNAETPIMNLVFYVGWGAVWGATRGLGRR
ncbi:MAG: O-antigen ligase family protein [Anaerolineae bacterium]|nr:O-antigen ligase family protein [Anaerolineae bacterium]